MADDIQNIKVRYVVDDTDLVKSENALKSLSKEEQNLAKNIKAVDSAAKQSNDTIQKEAKQSATAVDQTSKSFSGLADQARNLTSSLPGAAAVQQILDIGKAANQASTGAAGAANGFKILKVAIAATGIGALVIAVVSLIKYFRKKEEGAVKLDAAMRGIGAIVGVLTKGFITLGEKIFSAFSDPKQALIDLGDAIVTNVINRFKSVFVLFEAFQKTLEGDFSGGLKKAADAFIQFQTGIEDGTDKIKNFTEEVTQAALAAAALAAKFDDLEDRERAYSETQTKNIKLIDQLIIQAKNRTLSEGERIKIIDQAGKLEEANLNKIIGFERERLALIKEENAIKRAAGETNDELAQKEVDQINKITNLERDSILLQERLQNRRDLLIEQAQAKQLTQLKLFTDQEINIQKQRYIDGEIEAEQYQQNLYNLQLDGLEGQRALLEAQGKDTTEITKAILDLQLKQIEEFNKEKIALQKSADEQLAQLEKEMAADQKKAREEELKEEKALQEKKRAIQQQSFQLAQTIATGFFELNAQKNANELAQLEQKQAAELAAVGDNKQAQAIINKKFQDQENAIKTRQAQADKNQALFNIGLSTAQAIIKQLAATPLPVGAPLVALVAAAGAAQFAFAAAKPLPRFNKGSKGVPGIDQGGDSVLAMLRPGEGVMPVSEMNDYRPAFNAIFDRKVPAELINSFVMDYGKITKSMGPKEGSGNGDKYLKEISRKLDNIKTAEITMDKKGIRTFIKQGSSETEVENGYLNI